MMLGVPLMGEFARSKSLYTAVVAALASPFAVVAALVGIFIYWVWSRTTSFA